MLLKAGLGVFVLMLLQGVALAQAAPVTLMLYGDSLMDGYGLPAEEAFAANLKAALSDDGYDVEIINASFAGDTTGDGLARWERTSDVRPDAVLLGLGGNDMLQGVPIATVSANLGELITRFQAQDVPVLLLGMLSNADHGTGYQAEFNQIYPALAEQFAVALYPFFLDGVALDAAFNQPDHIHPNARGVDRIVERVMPSVKSLIDSIN